MPKLDDLKQLGQQFVDAAKVAGDATYSAVPEFNNFAKASFMAPIVKQGTSAGGTLASQRGQEADQADEAARRQKLSQLQDQADPSKYQKVRKADGGFQFLDPSGKEIDINNYAKMTGMTRAEILKDSENPIDQQYENDYGNMNNLMQAIYNNDTDSIKAFSAQNGRDFSKMTPQSIAQLLIQKYPHMYGNGSYQQTFKNRNNKVFASNPNYVGATGGLGSL